MEERIVIREVAFRLPEGFDNWVKAVEEGEGGQRPSGPE